MFVRSYLFGLLLLISTPPVAAFDCSNANKIALEAANQQDIEQLKRSVTSGCGDRNYIRHLAGGVLFETSQSLDGAEKEARLREVILYGYDLTKPVWQAYIELGEIAESKSAYTVAYQYYENALDIMGYHHEQADTNRPASAYLTAQDTPSPETVLTLLKDMERVRLMADTFIGRNIKRSGNDTIAYLGFRAACVTKTSIPIRFETDKAVLNKTGQQYSQEMLYLLTEKRQPDIELIGHADERGTQEHNQELSEQRALIVKSYLKNHGYIGSITISGKGEDEHYDDPDYDQKSEQDRWQLDRRVVLKINPNVNTCDQ